MPADPIVARTRTTAALDETGQRFGMALPARSPRSDSWHSDCTLRAAPDGLGGHKALAQAVPPRSIWGSFIVHPLGRVLQDATSARRYRERAVGGSRPVGGFASGQLMPVSCARLPGAARFGHYSEPVDRGKSIPRIEARLQVQGDPYVAGPERVAPAAESRSFPLDLFDCVHGEPARAFHPA